MVEARTYTGGCHCGAVRYEVTTDMKQVISCNCSICAKRGSLLTFAPIAQFKLLSGQDHLTDYQFASKTIHHVFCKTCGVGSYATGAMPDGTKMAAINVRCLDGVDVAALNVTPFDGKSL